jgi:sulfofructose kinase
MARVACLGMTVLDRILSVPHLPCGSMKVYATAVTEVGGGNASTGAVAVVTLGGESLMFGRVGPDDTGRSIRAELARYGVDVEGVAVLPNAQTGWTTVAIDPTGDRMLLPFAGGNVQVDPDWLDPARIRGCDAVLVDMGWPLGSQRMLRIAAELGIPSVIDADFGPAGQGPELVALARHVVFSEAGLRRQSGEQVHEAGLKVMRARLTGAAMVGVTLGPDGFLWLEKDEFQRVRPPLMKAVDTLGAGDVFHGAYALGVAEGKPLAEIARFAVAAATLKCTRPGGRAGVPSRAEVEALLAQPWPMPA